MVLAVKQTVCQCISPYLVSGKDLIVKPARNPVFGQKRMVLGSIPKDGGALILNESDVESAGNECIPYIRELVGAKELLYGETRWCLWMKDAPKSALSIPFIAERTRQRKRFLQSSIAPSTREYADFSPELFRQISAQCGHSFLALPINVSQYRRCILCAFYGDRCIASNLVYAVPDADAYDFGIVSSRMHSVWFEMTCGRNGTSLRYTVECCWNAFPFPKMSGSGKRRLNELASQILDARKRCGMALVRMYNPDAMPDSLKTAHKKLDDAVDRLYNPDGFASDRERLECLLRMYEEKTSRKSVNIDQWY